MSFDVWTNDVAKVTPCEVSFAARIEMFKKLACLGRSKLGFNTYEARLELVKGHLMNTPHIERTKHIGEPNLCVVAYQVAQSYGHTLGQT